MDFKNLYKNQEVVCKLLKNSFDNNRLFHLYLFTGQRGSLKLDACIYLASLILCENHNACGECDACKSIERFSNPNLFVVSPDGDAIKKDQIEELEREFGYTSDSPRVFIIQNIDKATLTASNTLLKFFEELPNNCYGVLTTENINKVLPTIRSRSQIVNFKPISSKAIEEDSINKGIDEEKAKIISKITNNKSIASRYTKDKDLDKMIEFIKNLNDDIENGESVYLDFVQRGQFLMNYDKDKNKIFMDLFITIQNDKINYLINRRDNIVFLSIENMNIMLNKKEEMEIIELLLKYRERMDTNANMDMIYTELFVEIERALA